MSEGIVRIGEISTRLALVAALFGFLVSLWGLLTRRRRYAEVARRSAYVVFGFIALASGGLLYAFLDGQYHIDYVFQNANDSMPTVYKISAFWGGMEGSLLFWGFILGLYISLFAWSMRGEWRFSYASGSFLAIFGVCLFFLVLLNFFSFPFESSVAPGQRVDGTGLNPILQDPGMAMHPPLLYLGFVGMTIPFAVVVGSMLSGHTDNHWLSKARVWTMVAWIFLGLGIMRGGLWAYQTLGWGGYWAWDPVENASFMPWLLATALLHSIMIQKHRGMLKVWNVSLAILAFMFTILGTFLTRSGLLTSVHTFAQNYNIGITFLSFLGILLILGAVLVFWRWNRLQSPHSLESFLSREFMFILNNFLLVGLTFVICWGTAYPTFSELFTGESMTVGPPYFNMVTIPLFIMLFFATGIGSLIGWRKASRKNLIRNFTWPTIAFVLSLVPAGYLTYTYASTIHEMPSEPGFTRELSYLFCVVALGGVVFTGVAHLQEFWRATASRMNRFGEHIFSAFFRAVGTNTRRYGGYTAHLGLLVVILGVIVSSAFQRERTTVIEKGETIEFSGYELTFTGFDTFLVPGQKRLPDEILFSHTTWVRNVHDQLMNEDEANATAIQATLRFETSSGRTRHLLPQERVFFRQPMGRQQTFPRRSEVSRDIAWHGDLYAILSGIPLPDNIEGERFNPREKDPPDAATFTLYYNPLVGFVWYGFVIMMFGALIALIPFQSLFFSGD